MLLTSPFLCSITQKILRLLFSNAKENYLFLNDLIEFGTKLIDKTNLYYIREVLLKSVWGENIFVESRTVDVHVRRLRSSLNKYGPDYIRTVRAGGYSIDDKEEIEEPATNTEETED